MTSTTALTASTRLVSTQSATGVRHTMTTEDRATTGRSVCGTDTALPVVVDTFPGDLLADAAVLLNDRHLDGVRPVCRVCRARVNVAALAAL